MKSLYDAGCRVDVVLCIHISLSYLFIGFSALITSKIESDARYEIIFDHFRTY